MTKAQRVKIEKLQTKMDECKTKASTLNAELERNPAIREFLPKLVAQDFDDNSAKLMAEAIAVGMPLDDGWKGDFKTVHDSTLEVITAWQTSHTRVETFINEYTNMFPGRRG